MNTITRTIVLSAAALVTVGSLAACSTGTPSATTTVTATPSPAAPLDRTDGSVGEQALVAAYESEFGNIDSSTEGALIDLGYTVCESFDSGLTFFEIGEIGVNEGIPAYETGFIIGSSVAVFCPEYTQDVTDAAQDAGIDTSGTV